MNQIFICGLGAVSPAGWGVPSLRDVLGKKLPLPSAALSHPGRDKPLCVRAVPPPSTRPAFLAHPRLRRASSISQHAAAAALEAVSRLPSDSNAKRRLGLIFCSESGCVQYSCRFFEETLKDPATASPLVFPETVFAAPTSHIAALIGNMPLACTLVGDPASFLQGLALAAEWLQQKRIDLCLVVGAEETHWVNADAVWHFAHLEVFSSGAGAVCLTFEPELSLGVTLDAITDAHTFSSRTTRAAAAHNMRAQLPPGSPGELLCDGLGASSRIDAAELAAWKDWPGQRLSTKRILGEALVASAAWQCVAACDAVSSDQVPAAIVSIVGWNQQAIAARFVGRAS